MTSTTLRSELLLQLSRSIVRHGFALVPVGFGECIVPGCDCAPDEDPWIYTIGMAEAGHPELIVLGLAPAHAGALTSWVFERHRQGRSLPIGRPDEFDGVPVKLVRVPSQWLAHDPSRMAMWLAHYGPGRSTVPAPPVAQLLWGDAEGRFPDDPACDPQVSVGQPILAADPTGYPRRAPQPVRRSGRRRSRAA